MKGVFESVASQKLFVNIHLKNAMTKWFFPRQLLTALPMTDRIVTTTDW